MRVCNRCRCPDPKYMNFYIAGKNCDMCENCKKEYDEFIQVIDSMEHTFMNNKILKHADFIWEDAQ